MSIEQMVRDLLTQAVKDRLVAPASAHWNDPDPQARTTGELIGTANLLVMFLRDAERTQE